MLPQIVNPDVKNLQRLAGALKGHAYGILCDSWKQNVIRASLRNRCQHLLSEHLEMDFLRIFVLAGRQEDPALLFPTPLTFGRTSRIRKEGLWLRSSRAALPPRNPPQ